MYSVLENPKIKVVGFEPAAGPLHFFRENVRINHLEDQIEIASVALSDQEGEIEFFVVQNEKYRYIKHNLAGEGNAGSKNTGRKFGVTRVKAVTLDAYAKTHSVRPIDLIKIDTEGTEHLILQAASHVLLQDKPIVICETLFGVIEEELEAVMGQLGYEFFNHTPKGLLKVPSLRRVEDNGVRNCFFVHPDKKYLINSYLC